MTYQTFPPYLYIVRGNAKMIHPPHAGQSPRAFHCDLIWVRFNPLPKQITINFNRLITNNSQNACTFLELFVSLPTEREGPARQKKRYAPNLRYENLRNFHSKQINAGEQERLPRLAWGCVSNFIYQVFSGPSYRNWQKQSRASAVW